MHERNSAPYYFGHNTAAVSFYCTSLYRTKLPPVFIVPIFYRVYLNVAKQANFKESGFSNQFPSFQRQQRAPAFTKIGIEVAFVFVRGLLVTAVVCPRLDTPPGVLAPRQIACQMQRKPSGA